MSVASRSWLLVLVAGFGLWVASTLALIATEDDVLLPTVVLLGSFLVPVAVIFWFIDHDRSTALSPRRLLLAFFVAGVLGLMPRRCSRSGCCPAGCCPTSGSD